MQQRSLYPHFYSLVWANLKTLKTIIPTMHLYNGVFLFKAPDSDHYDCDELPPEPQKTLFKLFSHTWQ